MLDEKFTDNKLFGLWQHLWEYAHFLDSGHPIYEPEETKKNIEHYEKLVYLELKERGYIKEDG